MTAADASLAGFMLREFTARLAELGVAAHATVVDGHPAVRFAAASPDVGDATVEFEDEEVTVHIGAFTHRHFGTGMHTHDDARERARAAVGDVNEYLRDLFADRLALWSFGRGAGGTFRLSGSSFSRLVARLFAGIGADLVLWSGARLEAPAGR